MCACCLCANLEFFCGYFFGYVILAKYYFMRVATFATQQKENDKLREIAKVAYIALSDNFKDNGESYVQVNSLSVGRYPIPKADSQRGSTRYAPVVSYLQSRIQRAHGAIA